MAKLKLTKSELKNQNDSLKRFSRYLPTLQLKKQQLQVEIYQIEQKQVVKRQQQELLKNKLSHWVTVFGEEQNLEKYIELDEVITSQANIAGVDIPVFEKATFKFIEWDLLKKSLWFDNGIEEIKKHILCDLEVAVLQRQIDLLVQELRITSQRVNLFEKVMIPQTKANIKRINVYLGDQQAAAVVRGKIAKSKIGASEG